MLYDEKTVSPPWKSHTANKRLKRAFQRTVLAVVTLAEIQFKLA